MPTIAAAVLLVAATRGRAAQEHEEHERKAFDLELAGRFPEAQNAFCDALVATAKEAARVARQPVPGGVEDTWDSPGARSEALFAWAAVLASNAHQLTYWTSRPGELTRAFEAARAVVLSHERASSSRPVTDSDPGPPVARELASVLTYRLMDAYLRTGDLRRARAESARLGFVTDWRMIGPFENEQGGGFETAYPPETLWGLATDYNATYPGKKHPVSWRSVPVTPIDGVIDLDACLRPNEEAIAYATTFLRSPEARDVTFRIGTDDGFELWLNGRKLASRRVERACTFDQDLVDARLERGWNQLLVKVADDHLDWEFRFRVTDRAGDLVRGLEVDSSVAREVSSGPEDVVGPAAGPRAGGRALGTRPGGALPYFRGRLDGIFACAEGSHVEVDLEGEGIPALLSQALGKAFSERLLSNRSLMESIFKDRKAAEWVGALPNHAREVPTREVARLWYAVGRLHASLGAHGVKNHPDREALARAVELTPEDAESSGQRPTGAAAAALSDGPGRPNRADYLHALSRVATDWVVMAAERNENPRVRVLRDLLAEHPRSAAAHYEFASYYLVRQGNAARTLEHAEAAIEITPEFPLAALAVIDAFRQRGWEELARARLEKLAEANRDDPIIRARWGAELLARGRAREALRAYTTAHRADSSVEGVRRAVEGCQLSLGKLYAAIDMENEAVQADPFDVKARLEMARLYEAKDDFAAAAQAAKEALGIAPENHLALEQLGRALRAMGREDEARAAWSRALELMPNYVELERYLQFLEGKTTYDRRFAEETAELLESGRAYASKEDDPLVEVLDKVMDRLYLDGTRSRTVHRIVLVRNNRGIEVFGKPYIFFYPAEQVVKVRTVRVHRSDGSVEEAPTGDDGRVVSAGYGGRSVKVVEAPPLRAGDMVEVEYRIDDTTQGFFGKYFGERVRLQSGNPRLRSKYVLIVPKSRELYFHTRGGDVVPEETDWPEEGSTVYTWTLEPAPKIKLEPLMPPADELGLQVQVSTYRDWSEFGRWYWNLVRDQHRTNAELEEKTRELVAGAQTEADRIRAVYDFVSSDIQYSAWEFGVHGFKPYRATKIFDQKFGDCKDKATLMKTMLGLLEIESFPALVSATMRRPEEDLTLPIFGHFNHMILYVPPAPAGGRKELWLDGTTTLHDMEVVPVSDAGALACVIRPDGAEVRRIPEEPPGGNSLSDEAKFDISRKGEKLSVKMRLRSRAKGWCANFARFRLNGQENARRMLERLYSKQFPSLKVMKVKTSDLEDISVPVRCSFSAVLGEFGVARGRGSLGPDTGRETRWFFRPLRSPFRGSFSGDWALLTPDKLSDYATLAEREQDLVLSAPWGYDNKAKYTLEEDLEFSDVPEAVRIEERFGEFRLSYELDGRTLKVAKRIVIAASRVKRADYAAFRAFCNKVDRAERREIGVRIAR
jgi:tetratricopeptide (TPR) repeat protein